MQSIKLSRILLAVAILVPMAIIAFSGGDHSPSVVQEDPDAPKATAPQSPVDATSKTVAPVASANAAPIPAAATTPSRDSETGSDTGNPPQIAREIIGVFLRNLKEDPEWGTRITKAEIAPLINQLYLARKSGKMPQQASFESESFSPEDAKLLDQLQQAAVERPDLNFLVETMFRQYDLLHCESLESTLRSWLIPS